jgi:F0F1-type ATP synthase assembly protein I
LEQNKQGMILKTIASITAIGGYIVGSILIGMYLDVQFFHNNGIAVIVCALVGILGALANIIKLVILTRDN